MKRPLDAAVFRPSDRKATEPGQNAAADLALPLPPLPLARARAEAPERLRLQRRRGARRRERSSPRKACAAGVRRQRPQNSRLALRGSAKPNSRASSRRGRRGRRGAERLKAHPVSVLLGRRAEWSSLLLTKSAGVSELKFLWRRAAASADGDPVVAKVDGSPSKGLVQLVPLGLGPASRPLSRSARPRSELGFWRR